MDYVVFSSLMEALTYAFREEGVSMLPLDRICEVLQDPRLYIRSRDGQVMPCSTIPRRRISSVLSGSELFVRAGPPRGTYWALRPQNPGFYTDGQISASIEQMLTNFGPMSLKQFVEATELSDADSEVFERFLNEHSNIFECGSDGLYWFAGHERPVTMEFRSISQALVYALEYLGDGSTVESLHWLLCMATVTGGKQITRRNVSRELSRRTDLFVHLSRARYGLVKRPQEIAPRLVDEFDEIPTFSSDDEKKEEGFDPVMFFDESFLFQC